MVKISVKEYENIVCKYICAKDQNRPHLMKEVFTSLASLEIEVKTKNISFPSNAVGLDEITDILIRNFSHTYENVYTICLADSLISDKNELSCHWLVSMTEKDGGNVRVGCGRYNWHFDDKREVLADHLTITIEQMVELTPELTSQILDWVSKLPYPWCDSEIILQTMPSIESLRPVRAQLDL